MKDRTVYPKQLMTLVVLALFTLGTEVLPGALSGGAAWLTLVLTGAAAIFIAALWHPLSLGGESLQVRLERRWGRMASRLVCAALLGWGLVLTAAQAGRIGGRLADSLRASPILLTAAVLLLTGWLAAVGLPALTRAGKLFALAVGGAFGLVLVFALFRVRWAWVLLWRGEDLAQVPGGIITAGGTLAAGCYALLLLDQVRSEAGRRGWQGLIWLFGGLTAALLLVLGRLGPGLTSQIDRPFFQMVSGLGFEGAFQRLEELVSALWVWGDSALLALLLLCMGRLLAWVTGKGESPKGVWAAAGLVFLLCLAGENALLPGALLPIGNLVAGGVLLLLVGKEKDRGDRASKRKIEKNEKT